MLLEGYSYEQIITIIETSSYLFLLLLMTIEGPIVTFIAAFVASLGFLNIWIILCISILGDFLGDILHYGFGRYGFKIGNKYIGKLDPEFILKLENKLSENIGKALLFIKFVPFASTPGLILSGALNSSFKKFCFYTLLFSAIKSTIIVIVGYYSAVTIESFTRIILIGNYYIIAVLLLFAIIYGTYYLLRKSNS